MLKESIVLITTGQPSLNPRLVKEADALTAAGYRVTVLYARWNDWGSVFDKTLLAGREWKAVIVGGSTENRRLTYLVSRVIYKVARWANRLSDGIYFSEYAVARSAYFLTREAARQTADIYIAHNLGALPAAVKAAKKYGKYCGFDAEDLHRYEMSDDPESADVRMRIRIENKYIPCVDYLTASSPEIAGIYHKLFPEIKPVPILNVFPKETSIAEPHLNSQGALKLFWFSQTIGTNRGLSDITGALSLPDHADFELHVLGDCTEEVKHQLMAQNSLPIYFHAPLPSTEITQFAAQFDIGLALEPGFSTNNNLALSNKIFTYLQAGLCVVASDTDAQRGFMGRYPSVGKIYPRGNLQALLSLLTYYDQHRDELLKAKRASYLTAREKLNWETEKTKFLDIVNKILSHR